MTWPLCFLLRKNQPWKREEPEQQAVFDLKQVLMQTPALTYPHTTSPYHLQLATTDKAISAVLLQHAGTSLKPVAFGSKNLTEVEKQFSACEKEMIAVVWALHHWEFIIGMSSIVLRTTHTSVQYVQSAKANSGRVSNPRLAGWTVSLLNQEVEVKKVTILAAISLHFLCKVRIMKARSWMSRYQQSGHHLN